MTSVKANGITVEYAETGPGDAPVILLIMGLGLQLIAWPRIVLRGPRRARLSRHMLR